MAKKVTHAPIDFAVLDALVDGTHTQPHDVLGPHVNDGVVTIRVLRPNATAVDVVIGSDVYPTVHEHRGVWVAGIAGKEVPDYRLRVTYDGDPIPGDDPYRFLPSLGDIDQHLIAEGRHEQLWQVMGAHTHLYDTPHGPVHGVSFAVWAPNAKGVRVVGDFNYWDGTATPMRSLGSTGIWEIFEGCISCTWDFFRMRGGASASGVKRYSSSPISMARPSRTSSSVVSTWCDAY